MIRMYNSEYLEYLPYFQKFNIALREYGDFYLFGDDEPNFENNWLIFIASRIWDAEPLINAVVPFLIEQNISFKVAKDQLLHMQLNDGMYVRIIDGINYPADIRKWMTIYPKSSSQVQLLIDRLRILTDSFTAARIPDAQRVGSILYIRYISSTEDRPRYLNGTNSKNTPFRIDFDMVTSEPKKKIYGGRFLHWNVVQSNLKGVVIKAIDKKGLSWCSIKVARQFSFEDTHSRDAIDRLKWEMEVMGFLHGSVNIPKIIGHLEEERYFYLISEWIDGIPYDEYIFSVFRNNPANKDAGDEKIKRWVDLERNIRGSIWKNFVAILRVIHDIHGARVVHRDIKPANFIISKDKRIFCRDFEISYSENKNFPSPPFLFGTPGYISPQQSMCKTPTIYDDIYSIGGLLLFTVTGYEPDKFANIHKEGIFRQLSMLTGDNPIVSTIERCFAENPEERPTVDEIIEQVVELTEDKITSRNYLQSISLQIK